MSEALYNVYARIVILLLSVWCTIVPMKSDNVEFTLEPVTTQSEYIYCECKNLTGRWIDEPDPYKLMKLVDGEWVLLAKIPIPEDTHSLAPGQTTVVCKKYIKNYTESNTLEEGKYKLIFKYEVMNYDREKGEDLIVKEAEVIFDVTEA